ncbi:GtrA family protein [Smaragdicoccus niigatensis]
MIGYALIGFFTFCVDMLILTVAHNSLHWPVPVAASAGYGTALILNFVLNRTFNFHVHGHFGQQAGKFAVAVGINYVVFVLGVVSLLVYLGVEFQIARLAAAMMEGAFLYCAMRFSVFRERQQVNAAGTPVHPVTTPAA